MPPDSNNDIDDNNTANALRLTIPPPAVTAEPRPQAEQSNAKSVGWRSMLDPRKKHSGAAKRRESGSDSEEQEQKRRERWNMGILNDPTTDEVPGSILLLSKVSEYNEPLGVRNAPARTSASSLPSPYPSSPRTSVRRRRHVPEKKKTADGKFVLEPQPDDSPNDPLNWAQWRRDLALLSLGFYCMLGGGMTAILAAGFKNVAADFGVTIPQVALTTGLYMMGLGIGSVLLSPTAILYGKRPVYLVAAVCFILSSVWCALSPNFGSLVAARIFMGLAASSVECLPSASVAEIFFLHEKAYRLGIYTLLLLGGKNLFPLISAAIIQELGWRWVFWVIAMVVGFGLTLLFFFVPETFWDRTPRPSRMRRLARSSISLFRSHSITRSPEEARKKNASLDHTPSKTIAERRAERHAHFATAESGDEKAVPKETETGPRLAAKTHENDSITRRDHSPIATRDHFPADPEKTAPETPSRNQSHGDYFTSRQLSPGQLEAVRTPSVQSVGPATPGEVVAANPYTNTLLQQPPKTFVQSLKPFNGRISHENWFKAATRPFVLFAYPAILWSALVYSLSIGWLIVLSESMSTIFQNRESYNFTSLQVGLVYISPFVGGILGTAVAGKFSDLIVRAMARRNGGIYEPEFRLVMAIPIAVSTVIGLMGYGWSAAERDAWIVPTIFFGIISFGCSVGSTTSITFAVDSYRQYAGEALVTLNFSKNVLHGLVFSLFFNHWLESDGSKDVFIAIGGIQLACLLTTVPMYIYGKRARMWTVRRNLMERF